METKKPDQFGAMKIGRNGERDEPTEIGKAAERITDVLSTQSNFSSLSLRDLMEARDAYHVHLMNKANVVGTAIGRYLIRDTDPLPQWVDGREALPPRAKGEKRGERTLFNSSVRSYSWPCVLVFVDEWVDRHNVGHGTGELHPEKVVPPTLYMPDGRMVPVCVVLVEQRAADASLMPDHHWPKNLHGGGTPIVMRTQGAEHRATVGCLATDGHKVYALTSRHVCGEKGEEAFVVAKGHPKRIGRSSGIELTRIGLNQAYPQFEGKRTYVNVDVGLIDVDDANAWTSDVFGLGTPGPVADLNELSLTLRLIDAPVIASGAASGVVEGRIKAMFYRYRSIGGFDHVADLLIAPELLHTDGPGAKRQAAQTRPGDSGMIWHLVQPDTTANDDGAAPAEVLRPLAVEWGGQVFAEGGVNHAFALASSLTTVCRMLNVEVVARHNMGATPYWGQVGHYGIASFAVDALKRTGPLHTLMDNNRDRISFEVANLTKKDIAAKLKKAHDNDELVPLADVPDIVWKKLPEDQAGGVEGGRDTTRAGHGSSGPEHPTHYADIDEEDANGDTLLSLCVADPSKVDVAFWQQFYTDLNHVGSKNRGLLPFRVWQFYDAMVAAKSTTEFLCAGGLVSHFVGDACQPLHGSIYADGYPKGQSGAGGKKGDGVHSVFESNMLDAHAAELMPMVAAALPNNGPALKKIKKGHDAAVAIVMLMHRSATLVDPKKLVDAYIKAGGTAHAKERDALWKKYKNQVAELMADGSRVLAHIWTAAWDANTTMDKSKTAAVSPTSLRKLYIKPSFVKSLDLDDIGAVLK